jgi:hypothetical protein
MDSILPCPVGLLYLIGVYDDLVSELNSYADDVVTNDTDKLVTDQRLLKNLRLVCSLILSIHDASKSAAAENHLSNVQKNVILSTARRCHILQQCIHGRIDEDDNVLTPLQVHQSTADGIFTWNFLTTVEENNLLHALDRDQLVAEEEILLQMANTPIPKTFQSVDEHFTLLQEQVIIEWGQSVFQDMIAKHSDAN